MRQAMQAMYNKKPRYGDKDAHSTAEFEGIYKEGLAAVGLS